MIHVAQPLDQASGQCDTDPRRIVDHQAAGRGGGKRFEKRENMLFVDLRYERRCHHRNAPEAGGKLRQLKRDPGIGMGAAKQCRRATVDDLDHVAEQRGPFLRRHGCKLAVGSPDQQSVEIHRQEPFDALGQPMKIDASIGHEWRDGNIEKAFEPGLGFARRHRSQHLQP